MKAKTKIKSVGFLTRMGTGKPTTPAVYCFEKYPDSMRHRWDYKRAVSKELTLDIAAIREVKFEYNIFEMVMFRCDPTVVMVAGKNKTITWFGIWRNHVEILS